MMNLNKSLRWMEGLKYIFIVSLVFWTSETYAQKLKEVTIDVKSKLITEDIPFDKEFILKGQLDEEYINRITFSYRVTSSRKGIRPYFPNPGTQVRYVQKNELFTFLVGPLHPNMTYEFNFELSYKPEFEPAEKDAIKTKLSDMMTKVLIPYSTFSKAKFQQLNKDLTSYIESEVRKKIKVTGDLVDGKTGNPLDVLKITEPPLKSITEEIIEQANVQERVNSNLKNQSDNLFKERKALISLETGYYDKFVGAYDNIVSGIFNVQAQANNNYWTQPFNSDYSQFTAQGFAEFISNAQNIRAVLNGHKKIVNDPNNPLADSESYDLASFELVLEFFETLWRGELKLTLPGSNTIRNQLKIIDSDETGKLFRDKMRRLVTELRNNSDRIGVEYALNSTIDKLLYSPDALMYAKTKRDKSPLLHEKLAALVKDPTNLIDGTQKAGIWDVKFTSGTEAVTMTEFANVLAANLANLTVFDNDLERVFLGTNKFKSSDGTIEKSNGPDEASVKLLIEFFSKLKGLKDTQGRTIFSSLDAEINAILGLLEDLRVRFEAKPQKSETDPQIKLIKDALFEGNDALFYRRLNLTSSKNWFEVLNTNQSRLKTVPMSRTEGYTDIRAQQEVAGFILKYLENDPGKVEEVLMRRQRLANNSNFINALSTPNSISLEILERFFANDLPALLDNRGSLAYPDLQDTFGEIAASIARLRKIHETNDRTMGSKKNFEVLLNEILNDQGPIIAIPGMSAKLINILPAGTLSTHTETWWKGTAANPIYIHPGIDEIKTNTYLQLGRLVADGMANSSRIKDLLRGKTKIENGLWVPSTEVHQPSILLLSSLLKSLLSLDFVDKTGKRVFVEEELYVKPLIRTLDRIYLELEDLKNSNAKLEKLTETFPDLLADLVINNYLLIPQQPNFEIETDANPYVGLDFGLAQSPWLGGLFIYEGFNVYMRPVNKNASFQNLKGRDEFWKRTSVFLGITQNVINNDDINYEHLIGNTGSLVGGVAFRFHRFVKVNLGCMAFFQTKQSPIDSRKEFKMQPTIGISFDLNVNTIGTAIGDVLGINK